MKTIFRSDILAVLAVLVLCGVTSAAAAGGAAPSAKKQALARAYVQSVPVENEVRAAVEALLPRVNPEQRVLFRTLADKSIDYGKLRAAAETAMAEVFTESEIKAMTAFFSTPEGRSIRAKMPQYEARMQPAMAEALQAFVLKLQENNVIVSME